MAATSSISLGAQVATGSIQGRRRTYTLLRLARVHDTRLLQLRNPAGITDWDGDWSDGDTLHWTRAMRERLDYDPDEERQGIFWMSWEDFVAPNLRVLLDEGLLTEQEED